MSIFKKKEEVDVYNQILDEAKKLFIIKSINETSMQEIADGLQMDVEKVYKCFETKRELVYAVAFSLWQKDYVVDSNKIDNNLSGIDAIRVIIQEEFKLFQLYPERFILLEKFDNFIQYDRMNSQKSEYKHNDLLDRYEKAIKLNHEAIHVAVLAGLTDGSIRQDLNLNSVLNALGIIRMAIFQKLANRRIIIEADRNYADEEVVKVIEEMWISYLKA